MVWGSGVRTKDSGSPPPQSCQPQMPRTLPQGRRHTVRGTLASLAVALQPSKQALFGELRSATRAVHALCAKAPNVARVAGSSTFSSAAPLLRRPNGRLGESAQRHSLALPLRVCKGCKRLRGPFPSPSLRCASGASSPQTVLPNAPGDPRLPPSGLLAGPVPLYVFHCPSHTCLARFSSLSQFLSTLPPSFFSSSAQSLALLFPSRTSSFWPVIFSLRFRLTSPRQIRRCAYSHLYSYIVYTAGLDAAQRRLETTQGRTETRRDEAALDGQPTSSSPFHSPQSFAPLRSPPLLSPYWAASPYKSPPC